MVIPASFAFDQQAQNQRQAIALPAWVPFVGELFQDMIEGQRIYLLPVLDGCQSSA